MLSKAYAPKEVEDRIYTMWDESGVFTAQRDSRKEPFTISMPPPNATGNLHLGHAVMLALEDIFIRFARMRDVGGDFCAGAGFRRSLPRRD